MTLLPYLRRVIAILNDNHDRYLDKVGGWRYALLLNRALCNLEQIVYHMEAH